MSPMCIKLSFAATTVWLFMVVILPHSIFGLALWESVSVECECKNTVLVLVVVVVFWVMVAFMIFIVLPFIVE